MTEPFLAVWPAGQVETDLPLLHYSPRTVMGRQIAAYLAALGRVPGHRFEIDSTPAILAMVAAGQGWSILTPTGVLHAGRAGGGRAGVALARLAGPGLRRRIVLSARAGTMGEMPQAVAGRLRHLLAERIVAPALAEAPWLAGALKAEG